METKKRASHYVRNQKVVEKEEITSSQPKKQRPHVYDKTTVQERKELTKQVVKETRTNNVEARKQQHGAPKTSTCDNNETNEEHISLRMLNRTASASISSKPVHCTSSNNTRHKHVSLDTNINQV